MIKTELEKKVEIIDKMIIENYLPGNKYVITDGIVDISKYLNSKFKILWILKEPHDKGETSDGWDIRDLMKNYAIKNSTLNPDMKPTFTQIIYSTYSILNNFELWDEMPYIDDNLELIDILKSIALINIKKLPAGSVSNDNEIQKAYQKYKNVIIEQIKSYKPDIIICGNTFKFLRSDLMELFQLKEPEFQNYPTDHYFTDKVIVLDVFHPAQRNSAKKDDYVNGIIEAVKTWSIKYNK